MNIEKYIVLGKNITQKFGHHTKLSDNEFDESKLFTPIKTKLDEGVDKIYARIQKPDGTAEHSRSYIRERLKPEYNDLFKNKPANGTGMWVSPITRHGSTAWYEAYIFEDTNPEYRVIELTDDCRVLIINSQEKMDLVAKDFDFDFTEMSKHIDFLYVASYDFIHLKPFTRLRDEINTFYGWDCISGLFLNPKFVVTGINKVEMEKC